MIADIICSPAMIVSALVLVDCSTVYNPLSLRYHHLLYHLRGCTDDSKIDDNPIFSSTPTTAVANFIQKRETINNSFLATIAEGSFIS